MIGQKFNFDEVFFRDLTICVLDTLEGRLNWVNRFSSGDIGVQVPIYYSLSGDERFLLDSFQDDIVSENRYVELNTDQIPRGHLTLNNFNIRSDEFRNPNVWLRAVVEDSVEVRKLLKQVRAIPITVTYDLSILLKTEVDVFKCAQEIMNTLWLYRFMYFEHNYMNIDAVMTMPDSETIEINREKNLKSDNTIKLTLSLEVQTYYPAFSSAKDCKIFTTASCNAGSTILKLGPVFFKSCSGNIGGSGTSGVSSKGTDSSSGYNTNQGFGSGGVGSGVGSGVGGKKVSSSFSEISLGSQLVGKGVPNGTIVKSVNLDTSEITVNRIISGDLSNVEVTFLQDPSVNVQPYKTRWFNNLQPLSISSAKDNNPNANNNNL